MYKFTALDIVELSPMVKKVWIFTSIIFVILVSLLFLPWQQTVKGEGTLIANDPTQRDYNVLATLDGFIEEFYVRENQFVKKGDKLFKIVDIDKEYSQKLDSIETSSRDRYKNSESQIENIEDKRANLKEYLQLGLDVFTQKKRQSKSKIESLEFKKVSLVKSYEVEKFNLERIELLFNDGIESKRDFEMAQNRYVKADAELKKIAVDIEIEQNSLDILKQEQEKFLSQTKNALKVLDNATLSSKAQLNAINQEMQINALNSTRYKSGEVVAQKDGYVVRILQNDKHKLIKKGEEVIHFSPQVGKKSIMLKVSDFNMPLIKEGLPVRIRFYGWPALQIAGWPSIKYGTFGGIIKHVEATSYEKGFFYARVEEDPKEPWPKGDDLRVGTQSTLWVRLSTVPIWYQIWRLMNAFPPQMVTPIIEKE